MLCVNSRGSICARYSPQTGETSARLPRNWGSTATRSAVPWRSWASTLRKFAPDSSVHRAANVLYLERRAQAYARADNSPKSMQTIQQNNEARTEVQPGFAWDRQDAYLFDIDGTLLRSRDRVHVESFASSVKHVLGFEVSLAGVALAGNTDTGILREACALARVPSDVLEPQVAAILEAMCHNVTGRRHELDLVLMPGVTETLRHLVKNGALLGVATGNLEMIGWIKIEQAGLREWFRFGGFSDQFPVRSELIGDAASKAREIAGARARICV